MRVRCRRVGDHLRDVARRVTAGREHVREGDHLRRPRVDARRESHLDRRIRQLHVRVAHDHLGPRELLHEVGHALQHVVRRVEAGAVVDEEDGFHESSDRWSVVGGQGADESVPSSGGPWERHYRPLTTDH